MKASEIKVGHIYFVDYDPVELGEFGKKHLGIVLKKNANSITFVTVPLTSNKDGAGVNKLPLGKLSCLPLSLQNKESYAVIDQLRTASCTRFSPILDNNQPFEAILPRDKMIEIYKSIISDLIRDVPDEDLRKIFFS